MISFRESPLVTSLPSWAVAPSIVAFRYTLAWSVFGALQLAGGQHTILIVVSRAPVVDDSPHQKQVTLQGELALVGAIEPLHFHP